MNTFKQERLIQGEWDKLEFIFEDELIQDPTMDETGRFVVDPIEYYGKAYLDAHIKYLQSRYE